MSEPLVCAVMLTKDRPEMARRAVQCFAGQTYHNKRLLVFDTGATVLHVQSEFGIYIESFGAVVFAGQSIGELRNLANSYTNLRCLSADVIMHWDDDDWSHPKRIEEQVALLQSSRADVVGYRDMLFWRDGRRLSLDEIPGSALNDGCTEAYTPGEAWLYNNADKRFCLGTSLCYWRRTWEERPFKSLPTPNSMGEDTEFLRERRTLGVSSLCDRIDSTSFSVAPWDNREPRMIASIHGRNTSGQYANLHESHSWKRVEDWDEYCRGVMAL